MEHQGLSMCGQHQQSHRKRPDAKITGCQQDPEMSRLGDGIHLVLPRDKGNHRDKGEADCRHVALENTSRMSSPKNHVFCLFLAPSVFRPALSFALTA